MKLNAWLKLHLHHAITSYNIWQVYGSNISINGVFRKTFLSLLTMNGHVQSSHTQHMIDINYQLLACTTNYQWSTNCTYIFKQTCLIAQNFPQRKLQTAMGNNKQKEKVGPVFHWFILLPEKLSNRKMLCRWGLQVKCVIKETGLRLVILLVSLTILWWQPVHIHMHITILYSWSNVDNKQVCEQSL